MNKIFKLLKNGSRLLIAFLLISILGYGQFVNSSTPNYVFPKPTAPEPIPTATYILPPTAQTYQGQRSNGSAQVLDHWFDIDGDSKGDQLLVWTSSEMDIKFYVNAVHYKIVGSSNGAILAQGTHYLGQYMSDLQCAIWIEPPFTMHVGVAYWSTHPTIPGSNAIMFKSFTFNYPGGLTPDPGPDFIVNALSNTTPVSQHISVQSCYHSVIIGWEDVGYGVFCRLYTFGASGTGSLAWGPVLNFGTSGARLPDVALNADLTGSTTVNLHMVYVETTATPFPEIHKIRFDFYDAFTGTGTALSPLVEDIEYTTVPFGSDWDDFQLKLDVPEHPAAWYVYNENWAYTYFNDDNNKIYVRVRNNLSSPITRTYIVNNGSMPTPSGTPMSNLTTAGNAFPDIIYNGLGRSDAIIVAWHTNYDPAIFGPVNNPLYTYSPGSLGYVSIVMDEFGNMLDDNYHHVDANYLTNRIGNGINPASPQTNLYHPKICFAKTLFTSGSQQNFTVFSSHEYQPNLIWSYHGMPHFLGKYDEFTGSPFIDYWPVWEASDGIGYPGTSLSNGTSVFLTHKITPEYNTTSPPSSLFKQTKNELIPIAKERKLSVFPNPFTNTQFFQIHGDDIKSDYEVALYSIDGKEVFKSSGKASSINSEINRGYLKILPQGMYYLKIKENSTPIKTFKLIKQ